MERFRRWMRAKDLTEDTFRRYEAAARHFLSNCSSVPPTKEDVLRFISGKSNKRWYWQVVMTLLRVNHVHVFEPEEEEMYKPKASAQQVMRPYFEEPEEVYRLVDSVAPEWFKLAILIAAETGARRKQICLMTRQDFNPRQGVLRIPPVKRSKKERVEYLSRDTARRLVRYLNSRTDNNPQLLVNTYGEPLKPASLSVEFWLLKKRLGIKTRWLNFHSFRRSYATWLHERGMDPLEIKESGGWESLQMVDTYVRLKPTKITKKSFELHPMKRRGSKRL